MKNALILVLKQHMEEELLVMWYKGSSIIL